MAETWLIILLSGALTYGIRVSFIALHGRWQPPALFTRALRYVPPAVLSAIILPEGSVVSVIVRTSHQAVLSVDGQEPVTMEDGDEVQVEANHNTACFVRFRDRGYFYRNITNYMEQNPAAGESV